MTQEIKMNVEEMISFIQYIQKIITELEDKMKPAIEALNDINFYEQGKAKKIMGTYDEANSRMLELNNLYSRAFSIINDIMNSMIEEDQALATEIAKGLGLMDE